MIKTSFSAFLFLLFSQSFYAQSPDAAALPLHILFHKNEGGSNGWSPDGKLFITYSASENTTKLWNLADESVVWEISLNPEKSTDENSASQTFVWSEKQKLIAVANERGEVYLLSSSDGKLVWKTSARAESIKMISFDSSGKYLFVVTSKEKATDKIELLNIKTGKPEKSFDSGSESLSAVSLSRDGKILLTGDLDKKVNYLNFLTGKSIRRTSIKPCANLAKYSKNIGFSRNLTYFAARCQDKTVITNVSTGMVIRVVDMDTDYEDGISFSGDEKLLVLENLGGYKIYNFSERTIKKVEDGTSGELNRDGTLSISGSSYKNRGLEIRDVKSGKVIKNFESHPGEITNLAFDSDGSHFAVASSDGVVRVWITGSGKLLWAKFANDEGTSSVAFSPNGKILVSSGDNENDENPIKVWDAANGNLLRDVKNDKDGDDGIKRLAFSPDGKMLLTTGSSVVFNVWDTDKWEFLRGFRTNEAHQSGDVGYCCGSRALTVTFDKSGKRILSGHDDGTVKIWEVDKTEQIKVFQVTDGSIRAYYSPNEKRILAISANTNTTKLIDAESGQLIQEYKTGILDKELDYVTDAAFDSDGKSFFTTSWFDDVMQWDALSGKLLKRINVGYSTDDELEISPNGKYLLAGGENQNILLFSAANGELVWSLFPINKNLRRLKEAEENRRIALVSAENEAKRKADIELKELEKQVYITFEHYGDMTDPGYKTMLESDELKESLTKKTVANANAVWLRLHNDSPLPIEIPTQSSYPSNPKCFFKFSDGQKINGLCVNREINIWHGLEDKNGEGIRFGFDFGSSSVLLPRTSVLFPVPLGILKDGNAIRFDYTFKNANGTNEVEDYGNSKTLKFRESDLPKEK